jgi:hypothetical protein
MHILRSKLRASRLALVLASTVAVAAAWLTLDAEPASAQTTSTRTLTLKSADGAILGSGAILAVGVLSGASDSGGLQHKLTISTDPTKGKNLVCNVVVPDAKTAAALMEQITSNARAMVQCRGNNSAIAGGTQVQTTIMSGAPLSALNIAVNP